MGDQSFLSGTLPSILQQEVCMDKSYLFSYKHDLTNYSELDHPQDKNKESRILAGYIIGVGTGGGEGRGLAPSFFAK